jgi:hypothetical protein
MKKIVVFGNCQAAHIKHFLHVGLSPLAFELDFYSNNPRTGGMKTQDEIVSAIKSCDVLVYQPLKQSYGELSNENIKAVIKSSCISVTIPYIFNSGVYSLCLAPMAPLHSYGFIFGQEIIIEQIKAGKNKKEIIDDYLNTLIPI